MVEPTGEIAEGAMVGLEEIYSDIDFNKKIVIATHDFETKIQALDLVFWHINEKDEYASYHLFLITYEHLFKEALAELK